MQRKITAALGKLGERSVARCLVDLLAGEKVDRAVREDIAEAVASLLILGILLWGARYRPWAGFHFWLFVALYGISRLALEIFRARPSLIGDGFLVGQLFSLGAVVLALVVMAYRFKSNLTEAGSTTV